MYLYVYLYYNSPNLRCKEQWNVVWNCTKSSELKKSLVAPNSSFDIAAFTTESWRGIRILPGQLRGSRHGVLVTSLQGWMWGQARKQWMGTNRQDVHRTMHFYALLLILYSCFAALLHTIPRCGRVYSLQDCLHRERWRNPVLNRFIRYSLLKSCAFGFLPLDFACSQIRGGPCSKSQAKCIVPSGNTCHVLSCIFFQNFLTCMSFHDKLQCHRPFWTHVQICTPPSFPCICVPMFLWQTSWHTALGTRGTCTMHLSCGNAWRGNSLWLSLQSFNVVLLGLWLQDSRFPLWQLQPNKCTSTRTSKNATNKQANKQKQYIGCESH